MRQVVGRLVGHGQGEVAIRLREFRGVVMQHAHGFQGLAGIRQTARLQHDGPGGEWRRQRHGPYGGCLARRGRVVLRLLVGRRQIIGRVVGQFGKPGLRRLEMLNGIREALLFEGDHAQGQVRQRAVDIFVAGRDVLRALARAGVGDSR